MTDCTGRVRRFRGPWSKALDKAILSGALTGAMLKAARRQAGLSQTRMGELIGFHRFTVSYWDTRPTISRAQARSGALERYLETLGASETGMKYFAHTTRARGDGVLGLLPYDNEWLRRQLIGARDRAKARAARHRQPCGAKTRKGHPCKLKSEPGKRRCKFHGGLSTGPQTPEGKARIADAQRRRWAAIKAKQHGPE